MIWIVVVSEEDTGVFGLTFLELSAVVAVAGSPLALRFLFAILLLLSIRRAAVEWKKSHLLYVRRKLSLQGCRVAKLTLVCVYQLLSLPEFMAHYLNILCIDLPED